jgi:phosphoribosylformylglycinamidine cyclo-ligase
MSHITGGGLPGNLPRVLPDGLGARVSAELPAPPPVFDFVRASGNVEISEMRRTFNMGVGLIFVVPESDVAKTTAALAGAGESPFVLGRIVRVPADRAFEERVEYPA